MTGHVRLVTWNCTGGGRHKVAAIRDRFQPDIVVMPEYTNYSDTPGVAPDGYTMATLQWRQYPPLVVLAADRWKLQQPKLPPLVGGIILPVEVSGPTPFRLMAVAAALRKPTPVVNPVVEAAEKWGHWLKGPLVVAGDFGTSGKAGQHRKPARQQHGPVLGALESLGLSSAYHAHFNVAQGEEQHTTYWHLYREDRPFHIDHIFTSPDLAVTDLQVGKWREYRSDHAPMFAQLTSTL
jgi:exodeoxyribonuclease III